MSPDSALADAEARSRIELDLDATLFVEAGAGSGKTTALVDRVAALVSTGAAELSAIAAITFTEKAGAELRDRIRRELQRRVGGAGDPDVVQRCRLALDQLDGAAIGTLHAFAQRLLSEHPIEAGLPPRVEVLDEVSSSVEFDRRWSAFRDELYADPDLERTILLLLATGVRPAALDALARAFEANWDLVAERVPDAAPEPPRVHDLLAPVFSELDEILRERRQCRKPDDKLLDRLDTIDGFAQRLRSITDELELLDALGAQTKGERPSFNAGNVGSRHNWPDINAVRRRVKAAGELLDAVPSEVGQACARQLGSAIRRFTLRAAAERRAAGRLEFHDLLVLARVLLRDAAHGPSVRARLHTRYARLLLDEFQDTDPIQIELAARIAAADPRDARLADMSWPDVEVAPGHLFVVGDPKQSIYRFRRADISTFLTARDRFGAAAGDLVELTSNFRSAQPVITWVNEVFGTLMAEPPDVDVPVPSQPDYVALHPTRGGPPTGAPVSVIGRGAHDDGASADELRACEAADVAAVVARVVSEGWSVDDGTGGWRPARLGDIAILVPARTSLPFLQEALDAAHIASRAESSSLVYATAAVRDVLRVLRAVDDPTNQMHVVAALRTPLLACGDDDLYRFKVERRGHWSYLRDQPESVPGDDRVRAALEYLRELSDQRHWRAPSELLDRIARDCRALELGFGEGRPRDVWRRLRFVVDQARAWSDATGGNLRQYMQWVASQTAEGSRVAESILPETDDDAVRIMTIHAAKGLEFPVTIVSGMSTRPQSARAPADVAFPPTGGVGYRFGRYVQTQEWTEFKPIDEQMAFDERVRLLYVACTRARDHLVVSLHRATRKSAPQAGKRTNAELFVHGMGTALDHVPDAVAPGIAVPPLRPSVAPAAILSLDDWLVARDAAVTRGTRPTTVAATALTDEGAHDPAADLTAGLQKRPRDLDLPPWLKGRYGTAVGRAVHGVLQTVDLATGDGLEAAVAAQCEAEAIPDRADQVRALVRDALRSPSVARAGRSAHWREVYACTPVDGRLLEGYIDLLYRDDDGLAVVDYKTAATDDAAELDRRVEGYRLQGASYALAVAAATAEPVTRVTFLFLTPGGPVERDLTDLDTTVERVRVLVTAGRELVADEAT
jgi:ATP-dependent exoDNAse (exonuclease V) beta subunit